MKIFVTVFIWKNNETVDNEAKHYFRNSSIIIYQKHIKN